MLPAFPVPVVLLLIDEVAPETVTVLPVTMILPAVPLPVVAAVIVPPVSCTKPVGPDPVTLTVPPLPAPVVLLLIAPLPESKT